MKIEVKTNSYKIISDCLDAAAARACNRCDKYSPVALTEGQRSILVSEFANSFWLALEDNNAEIV